MGKIAIVIDSTSGLKDEFITKNNIKVARIKVIYREKEFIDGVDITAKDVCAKIENEIPTTSLPSVQEVCDIYEELIEEGYTHVIGLPLSSGLSGTINSFRLAAEQYEDKIVSYIYDSKRISMVIGIIVMEILKDIQNGKCFKDVCNRVEELSVNSSIYFTLDTLKYLVKGGRIGKLAGGIGEVLSLKPIGCIGDEGTFESISKARGFKQAFRKVLEKVDAEIEKGECYVAVLTGDMLDEANDMSKILENKANVIKVYDANMPSSVIIHSGPKILGVGIVRI